MKIIVWCVTLGFLTYGCGRESDQYTPEQKTEIQLRYLLRFLKSETIFSLSGKKQPFPQGNTRDLEKWLEMKSHDYQVEDSQNGKIIFERNLGYAMEMVRKDSKGTVHLLDIWGRPIIYECPAEDQRFVFRLYSLGKKGIDRKGKEDNIDVSFKKSDLSAN